MRTTTAVLALLLTAGCDDDDDWTWNGGDPELSVSNTGGYTVRVEVEDVDDGLFYVLPGERKDYDLRGYSFEVRIFRTVDNLLLFDDDFDGDDFHDDRVRITVTP